MAWCLLRLGWCCVLELVEDSLEISGDVEVNGVVGIVLLEGDSSVQGTIQIS